MNNATVHNIRHEAMQPGDVYIGRSGHGRTGAFGNPFVLLKGEPRGRTIAKFESYARNKIASDPAYAEAVRKLHGKRLFCFCAPNKCHGHVLSDLAQELHESYADDAYFAWVSLTQLRNGDPDISTHDLMALADNIGLFDEPISVEARQRLLSLAATRLHDWAQIP